jgi:predicted nucleic acid-binding Zn ribbon protein
MKHGCKICGITIEGKSQYCEECFEEMYYMKAMMEDMRHG